ncbi:hypothetical protein [Candidatus Halocynthiibacter alkanivorans]|uniref:hypothetical protein n=1 Tax=Candidatus Halocynthiibacter alkanivorans TaxID=2267619 RepID=UPI000DF19986|nr:hypothetical protein [Candidatus Halocynthiibacter alkanivorans]
MKNYLAITALGLASVTTAATIATTAQAQSVSFSTGPAEVINPGLISCSTRGSRVSALGRITADDGSEWVVPAPVNFETAPKAADLFNQCGGTQLTSISELDVNTVDVVDLGGSEIFTAYIFADNYFELYVNGKMIAVDPVVFTPFNSNVVRFKADRPFSMAVMGVDWEENLGLGSENNRGKAYHPGDAGFLMLVDDAAGNNVALTDAGWKAQTFYTAPLNTRDCLVIDGANWDSSACSTESVSDGTGYSAAHWALPEAWQASEFDDSAWPDAVTFSNDTVGVDNKTAYTNFYELFDNKEADAQFIWSSNLVLDNLVLLRTTVE